MIFVDSNVPMYLVGAAHANKDASQRLLRQLVGRDERLLTDAEAFQEILHRYRAIDRPDAIQAAFDALSAVVDEVLPIEGVDVVRAKEILLARWTLNARDAVHVAVMEHHGISRILSFDKDFDQVPGIERVS